MSFECKDCSERYVGCHRTCESYLKEKEKIEERNERIRREKQKEHCLCDYYRNVKKKRKYRK